ncbi:hypothetical protein O0L34_g17580 [Tuta absoluta]|nr:hypothetical protein O0L34_g17580 [Tuta absoluta]
MCLLRSVRARRGGSALTRGLERTVRAVGRRGAAVAAATSGAGSGKLLSRAQQPLHDTRAELHATRAPLRLAGERTDLNHPPSHHTVNVSLRPTFICLVVI